ncbi:Tetrachloro-P-hydroquinone reductive dehalogenase [Pseudoprimorskyibacter insulae]|uniref:Tetrachloro-P-hydroquinone reductive dehalogenase n=2 Tax=Pseudoprimorskyibacter insulae TaxID=1695997 RepID=A0A2R8AW54_9RHOB|nr:Tetrachloro-P-hydroquinone reductive dehalogenase [Pseudoprimorskyibacter insulae]
MLKLYHGIPSVCSIKVRVALAEIGLDYESVPMNLQAGEQGEPDYLKLNPNGVVPTLIDGDLVVVESSLIIEYLDSEYNQGRLMPKGREAEVAARLWLLRCIDIHAAINTFSFATVMREKVLAENTPAQVQQILDKMPNAIARMKRAEIFDKGMESAYLQHACATMRRCFHDMDAALALSDWVGGPNFSLVDIALVAYVDRLHRLGFDSLYARDHPNVADWLARMQARDSYAAEVSDKIPKKLAEALLTGGQAFATAVQAAYDAA